MIEKKLIISHNTRSAGTLNITKNLLDYLSTKEEKIIITLPGDSHILDSWKSNITIYKCYNNVPVIGIINRLLFDVIVLPIIVWKTKPKRIICLANYFINVFNIPSRLIVRHPYLLEKKNLAFLGVKDRVKEFLRGIYFTLSLKTMEHVYLQSEHMYNLFIKSFPEYKNISSILANPINPKLEKRTFSKIQCDEKLFLYPSRYYPHKNHQFIIDLADKYKLFFIEKKIRFLITIDPEQKSSIFILEKIKRMGLNDIILNLGELSQDELIKVYQKTYAIFFPSQAETFGNGLIEGMYMRLPVITPDLSYAKSVMGEAGVYYENNSLKSSFATIEEIINNSNAYNDIVLKVTNQSKLFPNIEQWWKRQIL